MPEIIPSTAWSMGASSKTTLAGTGRKVHVHDGDVAWSGHPGPGFRDSGCLDDVADAERPQVSGNRGAYPQVVNHDHGGELSWPIGQQARSVIDEYRHLASRCWTGIGRRGWRSGRLGLYGGGIGNVGGDL